ncbi:hypothetical protein Abr02nite_28840 [Paractinoplanes brasiliensis]|nr:hypothetical protein [Actinoplanes brasiliensis]GID27901.1 hypothetical protein Abr02nite_28840 [Actinoplanes brasiliensis]
MDTQSIRAANHVPAATTGKDGKKVPGRKRGLAVDALGLIRAELKRLVNRQILAESQPGLFTLNPERTQPPGPPSEAESVEAESVQAESIDTTTSNPP